MFRSYLDLTGFLTAVKITTKLNESVLRMLIVQSHSRYNETTRVY